MSSTSSISSVVSSITSSASTWSSSGTSVSSTSSTSSSSTTKAKAKATSTADAVLYKQTVTNSIHATAADANQVGYLDENKSTLVVQSTLNQADTYAYYSFRFRTGDNIALTISTSRDSLRIQLMDPTGTVVYADSEGTTAQKKAYQELIDGKIDLKNGNYLIKASAAKGVSTNRPLNYSLTLSSGTSYKYEYKTAAGAQTMYQYLQEGGTMGYNASTLSASLLTTLMSEDSEDKPAVNILSYLS